MTMPIDLILVRHGQSEGNLANKRSRVGDNSDFTEEYRKRHSSKWRLTDLGIRQAQTAGVWIKENIIPDFVRFGTGPYFDRRWVSEYLRAKETAAYLGLDGPNWLVDFYLRERNWGNLDVMTEEERQERFSEIMLQREIDTFFWSPPGGQSIADLCLRIDRVLDTMHRECAGKKVIVVCHGEVMWAFRIRLERMSQEKFIALDKSRDPFDHIHNCQILHYTKRNYQTGEVSPYLQWMKSVCPTDLSLSRNTWEEIKRRQFSNDDLIKSLEPWVRLVNETVKHKGEKP